MLLQFVTVSVGLNWFVTSAVCLVSYAFGLLVVVLAFELGLLIWFAFVVCGCVWAFVIGGLCCVMWGLWYDATCDRGFVCA